GDDPPTTDPPAADPPAKGAGHPRAPKRRTSPRRSITLAAPPHLRMLDLGTLADDLVVTTGGERRLQTTYLDTRDLRLVRWGATLRHRAGEGWLLRLPAPEHGGHRPEHEAEGELRFAGPVGSVPAQAADLLTAYVRTASLQPVARLRTVRRGV